MFKLFDDFKNNNVVAGYTTDYGGVFGNNEPKNIPQYEALAERLGICTNQMIRVSQKHTDKILIATRENGGEGILRPNEIDAQDAIVTDEKNLMLCIVTADCVPLFLFDEKRKVIGLSHCSRVAIANNMPAKTVMEMINNYGCRGENIKAVLGPYLSQAHHEVQKKDVDMFREYFSDEECERFARPQNDRFYVDMGEAVKISLEKVGIPRCNVRDDRVCTFENPELFSWRRDHEKGRRILSFLYTRG